MAMETMNLQPSLTGSLVHLRPLLDSDFESLFSVSSDPLIWEMHPEKTRYQRETFERFFQAAIESKGALLAINKENSQVIGSSRFTAYDEEKKYVEIGYTFIARGYWGKGVNSEMKKLMLNHAFQYVDKVRFFLGAKNLRSAKALENIGAKFIKEVERQPREGARYFAKVYGFDRSDWI